jgi:hypothetical protein
MSRSFNYSKVNKYAFEPTSKYKWSRIGNLLKKCQYGISISMNETQKGYPIFRMNEIEDCFLTVAAKYAPISKAEFSAFKLSYNDILFNRTNSFDFVGRTGILKQETDSVFASYLIRIVPNEEYILPEFLTIYLNTQFGIGQVKRRAMHSINQANVSASELKRVFIPLIDIHLQQEIADIVNEAFKLKKIASLFIPRLSNVWNRNWISIKFDLKTPSPTRPILARSLMFFEWMVSISGRAISK